MERKAKRNANTGGTADSRRANDSGIPACLTEIAYELTMVKGLTIDQVGIAQTLRQNMGDVQERLTQIESKLDIILSLLKPS